MLSKPVREDEQSRGDSRRPESRKASQRKSGSTFERIAPSPDTGTAVSAKEARDGTQDKLPERYAIKPSTTVNLGLFCKGVENQKRSSPQEIPGGKHKNHWWRTTEEDSRKFVENRICTKHHAPTSVQHTLENSTRERILNSTKEGHYLELDRED